MLSSFCIPQCRREWRCDGTHLKYDGLCGWLLFIPQSQKASLALPNATPPATLMWMDNWPLRLRPLSVQCCPKSLYPLSPYSTPASTKEDPCYSLLISSTNANGFWREGFGGRDGRHKYKGEIASFDRIIQDFFFCGDGTSHSFIMTSREHIPVSYWENTPERPGKFAVQIKGAHVCLAFEEMGRVIPREKGHFVNPELASLSLLSHPLSLCLPCPHPTPPHPVCSDPHRLRTHTHTHTHTHAHTHVNALTVFSCKLRCCLSSDTREISDVASLTSRGATLTIRVAVCRPHSLSNNSTSFYMERSHGSAHKIKLQLWYPSKQYFTSWKKAFVSGISWQTSLEEHRVFQVNDRKYWSISKYFKQEHSECIHINGLNGLPRYYTSFN